jgi:hypothetical protein
MCLFHKFQILKSMDFKKKKLNPAPSSKFIQYVTWKEGSQILSKMELPDQSKECA